jgi:RNA polymerase sigma-70 factor (ECF subfamily)
MSSGATDEPLLPLLVLQRRKQTVSVPVSLMELSDEDLLLRVEAGDHTAAAILFDQYSNLIFGIGFRILRDRGEAEDLVQEVFLNLCEKVRGFDKTKGCGRTWIVQIAYRRAFDRRAFLIRRKFYDGTEIGLIKNTLVAEQGCEEQIADLVTGEQMHAAFEELNERQRATLEMYFFEGLDLREISERLGETLENTRHFYYRGLERLRERAAQWARQDGN